MPILLGNATDIGLAMFAVMMTVWFGLALIIAIVVVFFSSRRGRTYRDRLKICALTSGYSLITAALTFMLIRSGWFMEVKGVDIFLFYAFFLSVAAALAGFLGSFTIWLSHKLRTIVNRNMRDRAI